MILGALVWLAAAGVLFSTNSFLVRHHPNADLFKMLGTVCDAPRSCMQKRDQTEDRSESCPHAKCLKKRLVHTYRSKYITFELAQTSGMFGMLFDLVVYLLNQVEKNCRKAQQFFVISTRSK